MDLTFYILIELLPDFLVYYNCRTAKQIFYMYYFMSYLANDILVQYSRKSFSISLQFVDFIIQRIEPL